MGYATIRAAATSFFQGATIPGLNRVYQAKPTFVDGQEFHTSYNGGNGAVAYLHLISTSESRITLPAISGSKEVIYDLGLVVLYQYLVQPTDDPDVWVNALDGILDGLKALIRSSPTLGSLVIFEAAQGAGDIKVSSQDAQIGRGKVFAWNALEFQATEIIQA